MTEDAEMGREGIGVRLVLPGQSHGTWRGLIMLPKHL